MGSLLSLGEHAATSARLHRGADITGVLKAGLVVVVVTFGGFGTWAVFAPLSGAVVAPGVVKVDLNRKTVAHLEGGIVREILVRDGDHVVAGQTLLVVGNESVNASVDVLNGQLAAERIRMARLEAERGLQAAVAFPDDLVARADDPVVAALLERERSFFEAKRQHLDAQQDLLKKQMEEITQEIAALTQQVDSSAQGRAYLADEVKAARDLDSKQLGIRMDVLRLERTMREYLTREGEYLADISRARQKRSDLGLRRIALEQEYVEKAANDLTLAQAKIFDLQERLRPSVDAEVRQSVTAPIAGTVVGLTVFTLGGVVGPREPLLEIVPDETPLIIEAMIDVNSVDEIHTNMDAEVQLSAYKSRTTPAIDGRVIYVSADRMTNPETQVPYYIAHVELDAASLRDAGDIKLTAGMAADVFIKTRTRTALDYLLDPMTAFIRKSFRET